MPTAGDPPDEQLDDGPDAVEDHPESWPVLSTEDISRGDAPFAVRRDLVGDPRGETTFWRVVVEHPGAVVVLAVDDDERVLVLRQYRHPAGVRFVELPAGLLDKADEDPVEAARRELLEEAGVAAEDWTHLNTIHNSPGISDERVEVYLARDVREVPGRGGFVPEHEEADMSVGWVPFGELLQAVLERRVTDGPLLTAVLTYAVRNGISGRASL
ncbi:MAG: 8-oxo-dGDP phosphatase [Nocardioidaceae bacterium]|nr:8-oxo-dGDP phosphatase [Nocardioidaceae bacterium]